MLLANSVAGQVNETVTSSAADTGPQGLLAKISNEGVNTNGLTAAASVSTQDVGTETEFGVTIRIEIQTDDYPSECKGACLISRFIRALNTIQLRPVGRLLIFALMELWLPQVEDIRNLGKLICAQFITGTVAISLILLILEEMAYVVTLVVKARTVFLFTVLFRLKELSLVQVILSSLEKMFAMV